MKPWCDGFYSVIFKIDSVLYYSYCILMVLVKTFATFEFEMFLELPLNRDYWHRKLQISRLDQAIALLIK